MPQDQGAFSVREALDSLARLERAEPLLLARTEGLTMMVWGLITAAIFFTYQVVHVTAGHEGQDWLGLLWIPWVVAGAAATIVLWRVARVTRRDASAIRTGLAGAAPFLVAFLFVLSGALFAYLVIGDLGRLEEPGYMTLVLGLAALALALSPWPRSSRRIRVAHVVVGSLAIVAALLVALVIDPGGSEAAFLAQTLVGAFAVGGGWFVGGLLQAGTR